LVPEESSAARHRLILFLPIASPTNAEPNCSQLKDPGTFHFSFAIAEAYSAAARTPKFPDSLFFLVPQAKRFDGLSDGKFRFDW
jgi:hypothetical protein